MTNTTNNNGLTNEDFKPIVETIRQQIGWNAMACLGVPRRGLAMGTDSQGNPFLRIKTTGCGSNGIANRGRFVIVTLVLGQDLYKVEGVNVRGTKTTTKFTAEGVFADMLGDLCIEAADAR